MKYLSFLLAPFALLYGTITWFRNLFFDIGWLPSVQFKLPVISVGNISVGGTGKTPHTELLISLLSNYKVVVLSRGYGRKTKGFYWVNSDSLSTEVGDEPLQVKRAFPGISVAVCEKRVEGVETILKEKPGTQVVILDDAFQHRYIKPSFNILLNDYNRPIYKDWMLPVGRKREFTSGKKRADAVIVTKCPDAIHEMERVHIQKKLHCDVPVFFTGLQYQKIVQLHSGTEAEFDSKTSIILVTGIVNPKPVLEYLKGYSVRHFSFPDHHDFSDREVLEIKMAYNEMETDNKLILTTTKDASRLLAYRENFGKAFERIFTLPINVSFVDGKLNEFKTLIQNHVSTS